MFIVRAPLRISLAGGGTDLEAFSKVEGGHVLNFAISKYVYIAFHPTFYGGIRLAYSSVEKVQKIEEIQHPLFRNTMLHFGCNPNIEIGSFADIPGSGTGLGSSSAFTVALVSGISKLNNLKLSKMELATEACFIEIQLCKDPIGKQDQFASAFGGLNEFFFNPDGSVDAKKLDLGQNGISQIRNNLCLFSLNMERSASEILKVQTSGLQLKEVQFNKTQEIKKQVHLMKQALLETDFGLVGQILHENWMLKREMTPQTTNDKIDYFYNLALASGASGGKVLGAGGGGFLLLAVEPERRVDFVRSFPLRHVDFEVDTIGVTTLDLNI